MRGVGWEMADDGEAFLDLSEGRRLGVDLGNAVVAGQAHRTPWNAETRPLRTGSGGVGVEHRLCQRGYGTSLTVIKRDTPTLRHDLLDRIDVVQDSTGGEVAGDGATAGTDGSRGAP
jgi:hypothetical protein